MESFKEFIEERFNNKRFHHLTRMVKSRYSNEYHNIFNTYSFNNACTDSQVLYNYHNGIKTPPLCKCGKELNFKNINIGYHSFCSTKCSKLSTSTQEKYENTMIEVYGVNHNMKTEESLDKRKKTWLEKYGKESISQVEEIKEKQLENRRKTLENYGHWTKLKDKSEWELYRRKVMEFTRQSLNKYGEERFGKHWKLLRGPNRIGQDNYQIDHKISKKEGFINNIDPSLIGHIENLELIHWKTNNKKKTKSSITLEELLLSINS